MHGIGDLLFGSRKQMRIHRFSLRKKFALSAFIAVAFSITSAQAQLQWDTALTPGTPSGGAGAWDTITANWSDGTNDVFWDSLIANFGGASGGLVTLPGPIAATGINFNTSGYIIRSDSVTPRALNV